MSGRKTKQIEPLPRIDITAVETRLARIVRGLGLCVHHCHEADLLQGENLVPEKLFYEQLDGASDCAMDAEEDLHELNELLERLVVAIEKRRRQQQKKGGAS